MAQNPTKPAGQPVGGAESLGSAGAVDSVDSIDSLDSAELVDAVESVRSELSELSDPSERSDPSDPPDPSDSPVSTSQAPKLHPEQSQTLIALLKHSTSKVGREYWRSIEEALEPDLRGLPDREFPLGTDVPPDTVSRRRFLSLLGATAALGGAASGCMQSPREPIIPYTEIPKDVVPGIPLNYATTLCSQGLAVGMVVTAREGRPIKVEGNEEHPASLGATGPHEQAALLQLYDPDRSQNLTLNGEPRSWRNFHDAFAPRGSKRPLGQGEGLHFLLEPNTSVVVGGLIERLREEFPQAKFHSHAPFWQGGSVSPSGRVSGGALVQGLAAASGGQGLLPDYSMEKAKVILSLDSDFLGPVHSQFLRLSRAFAQGRKIQGSETPSNRLYVVEPALSVSGMSADHRLNLAGSQVVDFALALLSTLSARLRVPIPAALRSRLAQFQSPAGSADWLNACADDLLANRGRSLVVAGERQPAAVHALVHYLNDALGNVGETLRYRPLPWVSVDSGNLDLLVEDLQKQRVQNLFVLGGNPVYASSPSLELDALIRAVPMSVYLGIHRNETALACDWFLPQAHPLESWGDARAFDGRLSLSQPLIAPMYGGRTVAEVFSALLGERVTGHELLKKSLSEGFEISSPDLQERAIQSGMVLGTELEPVEFESDWGVLDSVIGGLAQQGGSAQGSGAQGSQDRDLREQESREQDAQKRDPLHLDSQNRGSETPLGNLELSLAPSYALLDGSLSNNPWLQELPDPVSKLTWDNALLLSFATAQNLGLKTEDRVRLKAGGQEISAPVLVMPGHADNCLSLAVGYGRSSPHEQVALGIGANAWQLSPASGSAFFPVSLSRTTKTHRLAITQEHWSMEGRDPAHTVSASSFQHDPEQFKNKHALTSLYKPHKQEGMQWAMSIDLGACTGCNACVVACQAENNIPVVGKADVLKSREMHWIRIDRYFVGPVDNPQTITQPMLCQHCENAPCEYVCPVNATTHSPDGINEMTYNRCVGTRFCSNNCPYKVRRFNWFDYTARNPPELRLAMNPEVTVRERGVMEKCNFCVQRVRNAQIRSRVKQVPLKDGDVKTACQQVCPTQAIKFGSISDPESEVSKAAQEPRSYAVLEELGVRPRVRYLARITNPNPKLS